MASLPASRSLWSRARRHARQASPGAAQHTTLWRCPSSAAACCLDGCIQCSEEARPVGTGDWRRSASVETDLAPISGDLAAGECRADVVPRPMRSSRRNSPRAVGEAAGRKRDVGGDADISVGDPLGDPIIGHVRAWGDGDQTYVRPTWWSDRTGAVGDDEDLQAEALGDAINLIADWAGITVNVDADQRPASLSGVRRQEKPCPAASSLDHLYPRHEAGIPVPGADDHRP